MTMPTQPRYALYFAPHESSDLWRLGSEWIGRCALSGDLIDQPAVPGIGREQFSHLTAAPRRYGFHATLKPPFRLAEGKTLRILAAELRAWCASQPPFAMPPLRAGILDDFLALLPQHPVRRLDSIAAECVKRFDHLRAPLTAEEVARRNPHRLGTRESSMLELWGYPYVMDLFRFHISLTASLPEDAAARAALLAAAKARFDAHAGPAQVFDAICIFEEPSPGADFRLVERAAFGA
jgi:putative phosphonate metabolism protein